MERDVNIDKRLRRFVGEQLEAPVNLRIKISEQVNQKLNPAPTGEVVFTQAPGEPTPISRAVEGLTGAPFEPGVVGQAGLVPMEAPLQSKVIDFTQARNNRRPNAPQNPQLSK